MIQTYSSTIRRKEMDAVLTCMVDEKIGPGELNGRLIQQVKEFFRCDGAIACRSPAVALGYALRALGIGTGEKVMISALAPAWQYQFLQAEGFLPVVLDVEEETALVTAETVAGGVAEGGRALVLHEAEGILPDLGGILQCGIPVIEDISMSAGASLPELDEHGNEAGRRKAGLFGVYSILGLEERDVVTGGGGAVLMAPGRREWIVLKRLADGAPVTDLLPDLNSALAWIQLKEFPRNEAARKEIFSLYQHSCMIGRHKMLVRGMDDASTASCFPLVLSSPFRDVRQYAARKDIEIAPAFAGSVIDLFEEPSASCIHAKSLLLRCAHFPLYPRLTHSECAKISKVLGSLP